MTFVKSLFWNRDERRIRSLFRIILLILLAGVLANMLSIVTSSFSEFWDKAVSNFLIMLAILSSVFLVGKYVDKREWTEFGITILPIKQFIYGALLGASLISLMFGVQYALGWVSLAEVQFNEFSTYAFGLVIGGQVFRYLCGSVFEEGFSRGYLLRNIAEGISGKISPSQAMLMSYIITSSIFGLLHLANEHATFLSSLNLILLGFLFGWMVIKTGKLPFSIGLHACWNIFQNNIFGFANSGKSSVASLYTFKQTGHPLWTGGAFGLEGGLICTIVVLLTLLVLWLTSKRSSESL